ncbi:hypothetical protein L1887_02084 [Cichorium endivia]|nr:hypothetical protein L1887_02084 [Cichorium endivia]
MQHACMTIEREEGTKFEHACMTPTLEKDIEVKENVRSSKARKQRKEASMKSNKKRKKGSEHLMHACVYVYMMSTEFQAPNLECALKLEWHRTWKTNLECAPRPDEWNRAWKLESTKGEACNELQVHRT